MKQPRNATKNDPGREKKQKTNVLYWIKTNEPYFVNSYELNLEDDSASYFVQNHRFSEPLIKPGDIYNLDNIDAERDRVKRFLVSADGIPPLYGTHMIV